VHAGKIIPLGRARRMNLIVGKFSNWIGQRRSVSGFQRDAPYWGRKAGYFEFSGYLGFDR